MKNYYINNKEFLEQIKNYNETKSKKIYEELGKKFLLIAKNYMNKPWFIGYSEDRKDEMISDAYFCMLKYMHNYDVTKTNPLSYFTMIAHNAFQQHKKGCKLRQERYVSLDLTENLDYSYSTTQMGGE